MHLIDYDTCSKYVCSFFWKLTMLMRTLSWGNWQYQGISLSYSDLRRPIADGSIAGVGNDPRASRQFNPIKQAGDYDSDGSYVRLWIPELKDVPAAYLQTPWRKSVLPSTSLGAELMVV